MTEDEAKSEIMDSIKWALDPYSMIGVAIHVYNAIAPVIQEREAEVRREMAESTEIALGAATIALRDAIRAMAPEPLD